MLTVTLTGPHGKFTMNATSIAADLGITLTAVEALSVEWDGQPLVRIPFVFDGDPLDVIGDLRREVEDLTDQLRAALDDCGV